MDIIILFIQYIMSLLYIYIYIYICNNEGQNKCNYKTPLNYDRGTLYLGFTFYLQIRTKKLYTKTPRVKV